MVNPTSSFFEVQLMHRCWETIEGPGPSEARIEVEMDMNSALERVYA